MVDPGWLIRALSFTILAAVLCAYLATCLLVWQGAWQLILSPSKTIDALPRSPFQPVRFDAALTGTPRLTAWWIPADAPGSGTPTILFLHDGTGSLSTCVRTLDLLHQAGVNIFAIDYRGFGQSDPAHPSEANMDEDSAAALEYLETIRHIPATTIVPYGQGLGAVLAASLANTQPDLPVVIIDTPDPGAYDRAYASGKTRLLPMRLLTHERFDIAAELAKLKKPKLILANGPLDADPNRVQSLQSLLPAIPDPKLTVSFGRPGTVSEAAYVQSITRFLDEYLHR